MLAKKKHTTEGTHRQAHWSLANIGCDAATYTRLHVGRKLRPLSSVNRRQCNFLPNSVRNVARDKFNRWDRTNTKKHAHTRSTRCSMIHNCFLLLFCSAVVLFRLFRERVRPCAVLCGWKMRKSSLGKYLRMCLIVLWLATENNVQTHTHTHAHTRVSVIVCTFRIGTSWQPPERYARARLPAHR